MWGAIAVLGTLLLLIMKVVIYFYEKSTKKATYEEDKQRMEDALARGAADDITSMFDDVRRPPTGQTNISGQGNKETP